MISTWNLEVGRIKRTYCVIFSIDYRSIKSCEFAISHCTVWKNVQTNFNMQLHPNTQPHPPAHPGLTIQTHPKRTTNPFSYLKSHISTHISTPISTPNPTPSSQPASQHTTTKPILPPQAHLARNPIAPIQTPNR